MTDATWPAELPSRPLVDGYSLKLGNGAARTDMESGPPKVRRRFTAAVRPVRMVFRLTAAQVAALRTFYETTCAFGAVAFTFADPISGATQRFGFTEPPEISTYTAQTFNASLRLEVLPA